VNEFGRRRNIRSANLVWIQYEEESVTQDCLHRQVSLLSLTRLPREDLNELFPCCLRRQIEVLSQPSHVWAIPLGSDTVPAQILSYAGELLMLEVVRNYCGGCSLRDVWGQNFDRVSVVAGNIQHDLEAPEPLLAAAD